MIRKLIMRIKKKFNKGFTLLELLVVIAIIGILASVILLFINVSRARAQDSKTKTVLNDVQTLAQEEKLDTGTYAGICTDASGKAHTALSSLAAESNISDQDYGCYEEESNFSVIFPLKAEDGFWCIDANGNSKEVSSSSPQGTPYDCNNFNTATPLDQQQLSICDYPAPPLGCNYVHGPNYDPETMCGMVLNCPDGFPHGQGELGPVFGP